jgi:hypothetical protein
MLLARPAGFVLTLTRGDLGAGWSEVRGVLAKGRRSVFGASGLCEEVEPDGGDGGEEWATKHVPAYASPMPRETLRSACFPCAWIAGL